MTTFSIEKNGFYFNGQPIRIISGAIHYFRVHPEYWEDRLLKLKACGFNTVETYVAWNIHEPKPGAYNFDGFADIERFLKTAQKLDLHVILRPGPYICAEWEFGGLPAWLLAEDDIALRCYDHRFLEKVDRFFDVLIHKVKPFLCTNGGPIIMVQVENEYGSFGNDKRYLNYLKDGLQERGVDVPLFTSDGPTDVMLQGGTLPDVFKTVNFGARSEAAFAKLREYQPDGPLMCMEFWNGWFDHWGEHHHTRDAEDVAVELDKMLTVGASVNFYMFHGGTNFGFTSGANFNECFQPTVTSYDYDVLINEHGEPTEKFAAVKKVLEKHGFTSTARLPEPMPKKGYGKIEFRETAGLFTNLSALSEPMRRIRPETMEKLGQNNGFILYETRISGPRPESELMIDELHDRALVYLDGVYQGVVERWVPDQKLTITIPNGGAKLSLLVENMGRVNYGPRLKDRKGITNGVRLDYQFLYDWEIRLLPLDDLRRLNFFKEYVEGPAFHRATFVVDEPADTFIDMCGWTKGVVFINGFNIGRYWHIGPQQTLYVPAPLLKSGQNDIIVFELHGQKELSLTSLDYPKLGANV
ncbi:beta-galactosidase family protein [Camelliibacillus cellulosilyticus]|uniref:Beta-galactosidase family protein n=1 Tax=Camelliibacillus cellulosilyticus TaxID=2174486 RepID=A0ABV9GPB6_9BACL